MMFAAILLAAQFLWLSDIHFNPLANPGLVKELERTEISGWEGVLNRHPGRLSRYTEDTNWPLFSSALQAARKTAAKAEFTVVTGDILVHLFRAKYQAATQDKSQQGFENFARKTTQFVLAQLGTVTPGRSVLLALGNNDSECGDYQMDPGGPFLRDSSRAVARLLGGLADEGSERDWQALGVYNIRHPWLKNYRVFALNSVFFSPKYSDGCRKTAENPAQKQLEWLKNQLAAAKRDKKRVWLVFHIPPGIDGYATSHPPTGPPKVVGMWKPEYTEAFEKLLREYRGTVETSLAGHEHMDDFRLLPHSVVLITPGVSPIIRQNPAFRMVTLQANGKLTDQATYYLANLEATQQGATPEWKEEYSFVKAWKVHPLDFKSFSRLFGQIEKRPPVRELWSTFYTVSHPAGGDISTKSFPWLFCASGHTEAKPYLACVDKLRKD